MQGQTTELVIWTKEELEAFSRRVSTLLVEAATIGNIPNLDYLGSEFTDFVEVQLELDKYDILWQNQKKLASNQSELSLTYRKFVKAHIYPRSTTFTLQLGVVTELAEVLSIFKAWLEGKQAKYTREDLVLELGDVFFYLLALKISMEG